MKSLRIEDLDGPEALDGRAMSAFRGGTQGLYWPMPYYLPMPVADTTNFSAQQVLGQSSNVFSNTGSGGVTAIIPFQHAGNTINFPR